MVVGDVGVVVGCGEIGETVCGALLSRTMGDDIEVVGFQGELGSEEYMEREYEERGLS